MKDIKEVKVNYEKLWNIFQKLIFMKFIYEMNKASTEFSHSIPISNSNYSELNG